MENTEVEGGNFKKAHMYSACLEHISGDAECLHEKGLLKGNIPEGQMPNVLTLLPAKSFGHEASANGHPAAESGSQNDINEEPWAFLYQSTKQRSRFVSLRLEDTNEEVKVNIVDAQELVRSIMADDEARYAALTSPFTDHLGQISLYNEFNGSHRFDMVSQHPQQKALLDAMLKNSSTVTIRRGETWVIDTDRLYAMFLNTSLRQIPAEPIRSNGRKYILFDVDNTLCVSDSLSFDWKCLASLLGLDHSKSFQDTDISETADTDLGHIRHILRSHGVSDREMQSKTQSYFRSFRPSPRWVARPCPGASETLRWIQRVASDADVPVTIGLWTGNSRANTVMKLEAAGIISSSSEKPNDDDDDDDDGGGVGGEKQPFDWAVSSFGDQGPTKRAIFHLSRRAMERRYENLQVDPDDIMLVGDTPSDMQVAKDVGCRMVGVTTGFFDIDDFGEFKPRVAMGLQEAWPMFVDFITGNSSSQQ